MDATQVPIPKTADSIKSILFLIDKYFEMAKATKVVKMNEWKRMVKNRQVFRECLEIIDANSLS